MTKQKVLAVAGVLGISALILSAGTLAFFTDTDSKTNTFTVGKGVDIQLVEKERVTDDQGVTTLQDFTQDKVAYPIIGSAQGTKDEFGMPTAKNYMDKMVTVKNTGETEAWVSVYVGIPKDLDDNEDASKNTFHFNFGNTEDGVTTYNNTWSWTTNGAWNLFETDIDGITYSVYRGDYMVKLPAGQTTTRAINGGYLDKNFNYKKDAQGNDVAYKGDTKLDYDFTNGIKMPVFSVAIQAEGFNSAAEAIEGAFGANFNPFAE